MHPGQGGAGVEQVLLLAHSLREHVGHRVDEVERDAHGILDLPGVDVAGGAVDRDQLGHASYASLASPSAAYILARGLLSSQCPLNHLSLPEKSP